MSSIDKMDIFLATLDRENLGINILLTYIKVLKLKEMLSRQRLTYTSSQCETFTTMGGYTPIHDESICQRCVLFSHIEEVEKEISDTEEKLEYLTSLAKDSGAYPCFQ